MQEIQLRFDYEALDTETRRFVQERTERIHNLARMTATGIVQIGQYVTEVKERLKHGKFEEWIEREFGWSKQAARDFMHVHQCFKATNFVDLEIDVSALYLIARPSAPEPVRSQAIQRAQNGEAVTHAGVRAMVQHFAETGEMPEVKIDLPKLIEERRVAMRIPQPQEAEPPRPPINKATAAEIAEEDRMRALMKANSERVRRIFEVIESIECLCGTTLTVPEIASEIRRLDTPDKDWRGQLKVARQKLADLSLELKS